MEGVELDSLGEAGRKAWITRSVSSAPDGRRKPESELDYGSM